MEIDNLESQMPYCLFNCGCQLFICVDRATTLTNKQINRINKKRLQHIGFIYIYISPQLEKTTKSLILRWPVKHGSKKFAGPFWVKRTIVEVKWLDYHSTGHNASNERTKRRKNVKEQAERNARVFQQRNSNSPMNLVLIWLMH